MPAMQNLSLTDKERSLAEKTEISLHTGRQLIRWYREASESAKLNFYTLDKTDDTLIQAFNDRTTIDGKPVSVMGCVQSLRFRRLNPPPAGLESETLESFVAKRYFKSCTWQHDDGLPGGMGFQALLGKEASGSYLRIPEAERKTIPDLNLVGREFEWLLLQVDLYDFVRSIPQMRPYVKTLSKFIKEAAYLGVHRDMMGGDFKPSPGVVAECRLGYSFVPATVYPNIFGYGPGRFGAAFKLFHFEVRETGEVQITMSFLTAPRSEKVFYLWGFDPVYPAVQVADWLTLGMLRTKERVHDYFDATFMKQHGMVHQNFIQGMRRVWEDQGWAAASGKPWKEKSATSI